MSLNKMDKPVDTLFYFLFQQFSNSSFKLLPVTTSLDTRFSLSNNAKLLYCKIGFSLARRQVKKLLMDLHKIKVI